MLPTTPVVPPNTPVVSHVTPVVLPTTPPPVRQRSVSTRTITTDRKWYPRGSGAAQTARRNMYAVHSADLHAAPGCLTRRHGTTPAYQAKDASLCSLSAAISTAQANQGGSQHGDRATIIMSPPGSPKPSWGGYWGSWPFGQIYEKCTLRSLGLLGERRMHTGVQRNDPDRATAQSQAFTAPSKSGGYRV
jgi:hypothetical protein